ncbi:MAG: hypothetical protein ACFFFB_11945 [Candidatus Heimdallarchaeota archaeon]
MFHLILLIGTYGLLIAAFILLYIDLISSKKYQNKSFDGKFPKLTRNSVIMTLVAIVLLVFISLGTV